MKSISLGKQGEILVANYLHTQNYIILATNYRTLYGEIDIIAQKGDIIAFIEVKTRNRQYLPLGEIVNYSKQKKLAKTASHYIAMHQPENKSYRFDVAFVDTGHTTPLITHIPHAFINEAL